MLNVSLNKASKIELTAKTLNQPNPAEVGYMRFSEGEMIFLGTSGHAAQSTPLGPFVP